MQPVQRIQASDILVADGGATRSYRTGAVEVEALDGRT